MNAMPCQIYNTWRTANDVFTGASLGVKAVISVDTSGSKNAYTVEPLSSINCTFGTEKCCP
jgi:hypothetical protein